MSDVQFLALVAVGLHVLTWCNTISFELRLIELETKAAATKCDGK